MLRWRIASSLLPLVILVWMSAKGYSFQIRNSHHLPHSRIIGGTKVHPRVIPYIVRLAYYYPKIDSSGHCGGTLISDRHIITAGHCVRGNGEIGSLKFGAYKDENDDVEKYKYTTTEGTIIRHSEFNLSNVSHDIAIIKLSTPLNLDPNYIWPIQLFDPSIESYAGRTVQAYGWGFTNDDPVEEATELMGVNLTVIDKETCLDQLKKLTPTAEYLHDYEICTSGVDEATSRPVGVCHGDSGGPLVYNETLIGVTSRVARGQCAAKYPAIFVSVRDHWSWIYEQLKKH